MVGFRGSWTKATRDLAMRIPLSDLLLETDAPFMVPNLPPDVPNYSVPGMALCVAQSIAGYIDDEWVMFNDEFRWRGRLSVLGFAAPAQRPFIGNWCDQWLAVNDIFSINSLRWYSRVCEFIQLQFIGLRSNSYLSDGATLKDIVSASMNNTCKMYGINPWIWGLERLKDSIRNLLTEI